MRLIGSIILNGVLIYLVSRLLEGVYIENFLTAIIAGLALGIINFFVKPVLTLLTLPITILTLGLFLLIINGAMILLVDYLVAGFEVRNMLWAVIFSLLLAFFNFLLGNYEWGAQKRE